MTTGGAPLRTVGELGEFGLIDEVTSRVGQAPSTLIGPGDDAAHLAPTPGGILVSTDLLIEGRHFRRDWSSAREIGRKAAAANLSDINAMGGTATALTVGFAAPADLPLDWVLQFTEGFEQEASVVGAHIVGGDMSAADSIVIAVTALGEAATVVPRSGARPGDRVAVAGALGLAGAGYAALSRGFRSPKAAVEAHRVPEPPYQAGPAAAAAGATAMTDISDGLLADLGHIAAASVIAIDVDPSAFEIPTPVATVAEALGGDPLTFVLTGGDDYALAATFGPTATIPSEWTVVGTVTEGEGVTVGGEAFDEDTARGHQHFR